MKSNIKIIITIIIAVLIGLGIGYLIFGKNATSGMDVHKHHEEADLSSDEEWICSMHPQIRQSEPGLCPICEMDLIPAGGNQSDDPLVLQMTASAVKLANIQTSIIESSAKGSEGKTIRLSGKVQADERLASSQTAHVPGRIEKLYVTFTGESVSTGQKLADIYSPDLITAQRELLEAMKLQSINPNLVEAARNKLKYWKVSDSIIANIKSNGKIQETFPLYATKSGIVTNRSVAVGDYLKQGESLFELINLRKVWVLFDVYEEDLANIKIRSNIEFTTPAYPDKTFKTKVTFIDPVINQNTRVASIRTEVNNTSNQLKPEMFVNGILKASAKSINNAQLTVPKTAVLWTGKRSVVYVKVPDTEIPSFQYREIEIGERLGNNYQVLSGLKTGEEVVTYGSFTIDAAAQLNNQASMMNKDVSLKKEDTGGVPDFEAATPIAFKEQLNTLAKSYIQLKDAFVATDASAAATAAQRFLTQLENVDMKLINGDAHLYWMDQLNGLQAHSRKITKLTDVEDQRKQFGFLSDVLINTIKAFGIVGDVLYIQHCPMAFNNQGGDWIAVEEQIQNPYFGDKMMRCGLVKNKLESAPQQ